jgi:hypothetical protein
MSKVGVLHDTLVRVRGLLYIFYASAVRCSFLYTEWKAMSYAPNPLLLLFVFRDHTHPSLIQLSSMVLNQLANYSTVQK